MRQAVFPIAVRLARGQRVALGPAVLASLYRDLRDIKAFLVAAAATTTTGNADMLSTLSLYAPLYILQLWMWERFPALRPGRDNPVRDGEPMATRWHDLSRRLNPTLIREALSSEDNFAWEPYVGSVKKHTGWVRSSDLAGNDELRSLAHCLRPSELVGMDCIEQYLPHRVARQFGLDQDVPGDVLRANQDWVVAWQTYELEGKNVSFFIPHSKPGITAWYAQWWRQQLPPSDLNAGAASIPVEWKASKRKVKKTPAAMEAEAEKERKLKKARPSPSPSDKKRKLEELYDAKLSDWLTTARNGISDAAGGSCNRGSLPKYDMGSDEALLPNIQNSNDDVVLLMPRKQTASPAVMALKDNDMHLALGERGNFIVYRPPDVPSGEPEGGVTETLEEEKLNIPVDRSLDITDRPEGAPAVMELPKEASGVSDRAAELTTPAIQEIEEEKVAIEGAICIRETSPSEKDIAIVTKADGGVGVSEKAGRATKEGIEAAPQNQQEVDAGVMNVSHDAVALPEEEPPIQRTNNGGGCSDVSCIMEDSNVAGGLSTNDGETTGCDFVVQEGREVPCVEEIGGGENNEMVEKSREEKPQEAPQIETMECLLDTVLRGTDNDGEQKMVPPRLEEVGTSNNMALVHLGVAEVENTELNKDINLAKKDSEDMPVEGAEEENTEFSEVHHTDMAEPKMHSHFTTEKPEKTTEVECDEIDGTTRLTGRDTDGKLGDVPEVGHAKIENIRGLIVNAGAENLAEVSQVEPAEVVDIKGLMKEDTDNKPEDVPESENTESEGTHGPMEEDTDGRPKEIDDVNAELEKADGHEGNSDRPEGISQVDLLTGDEARWLAKEEIGDNITEVPQIEYAKLRDEAPIEEDTREKPHADSQDLPEKDVEKSEEADKLEQEGEGCKVSMEKDKENINDALGVEQAEGQGKALTEKDMHNHVEGITLVEQLDGQSERLTRIGTDEIPEETTQTQEKEFDKDVVEDSEISTNAGMPCSSATGQLKENQKEVSHEGMIEEQCIQNVELINQREPSSDATPMGIEGVYDHKTLDMHEEVALKQKQDSTIICENREMTMLESSHMLNSGVKSDLVTLEVDETHAAGGIQNQEILDLDKQLAMEERQDQGTTIESNKMSTAEDADILVRGEYQIDPTGTDVNEVELTKGIQNHELQENKKQLEMEEKQEKTTIENDKINMSEDAATLVCGEYQIDPAGTEVNEVKSNKGIQNQRLLDNKKTTSNGGKPGSRNYN
uniref:Aminotransferase-like plant mobile domain-containing protein n=1 Tax=Arundo donax TaxID=35708 RepID=A0A0A9D0T9_ARUDO